MALVSSIQWRASEAYGRVFILLVYLNFLVKQNSIVNVYDTDQVLAIFDSLLFLFIRFIFGAPLIGSYFSVFVCKQSVDTDKTVGKAAAHWLEVLAITLVLSRIMHGVQFVKYFVVGSWAQMLCVACYMAATPLRGSVLFKITSARGLFTLQRDQLIIFRQ